MPSSYPIPWKILPGLVAAVLTGRRRSFRTDSLAAISLLESPLEIHGQQYIPSSGPCLLTTNHFSAPGFNAWWFTFALSAALPLELHWIMTGAWIFPGKFFEAPMRIFSTWLFPRIAQAYGFTTMTPIPPCSTDVQGRARAVRRILEYAHHTPNPVIGLAPEGTDFPGGVLGAPPPGLGRFVARLAPLCQVILPAGVFESGGRLCVQLGEPYTLHLPASLPRDQLDSYVSQTVMRAIARQLPPSLQGEFKA